MDEPTKKSKADETQSFAAKKKMCKRPFCSPCGYFCEEVTAGTNNQFGWLLTLFLPLLCPFWPASSAILDHKYFIADQAFSSVPADMKYFGSNAYLRPKPPPRSTVHLQW